MPTSQRQPTSLYESRHPDQTLCSGVLETREQLVDWILTLRYYGVSQSHGSLLSAERIAIVVGVSSSAVRYIIDAAGDDWEQHLMVNKR